jgi:protease I
MASQLSGKKIAFLVAQEGVEEVELTEPWRAVEQAGGKPELVAPENGEVQAFNDLDKGSTFHVDKTLQEISSGGYDGLVLPGGVANPDQLRTEDAALRASYATTSRKASPWL